MSKRALAVILLVASLAGPTVALRTAEAATEKAQHCVVHVTGKKASGELILSSPRCYATFEGAMAAEGVAEWGQGAATRAAARSGDAAALSFTLGVHYDYTSWNPAGGSTSTVGTGCTGGWLNTSAAWNNRIGSTANGCPNIHHFDGFNLTGQVATTTGAGGNLGTMNNRTSSIQYA